MNQQNFDKMDADSRDLLLFDYLEGNLSQERTRALEEALAADPDLRAELEHWKESFVVQDFWATDLLEEQLLQGRGKTFSFSGPAAGFMLVLVASLFSFLPVSEQQQKHFLSSGIGKFAVAVAQKQAQPGEQQHELNKAKVKAKTVQHHLKPAGREAVAASAQQTGPAAGVQESILPEIARHKQTEIVSMQDEVVVAVEVHELTNAKSGSELALEPREISKKQQRQISRMKKKALQRKQANEFLKGKRPYVVPLNTKNF